MGKSWFVAGEEAQDQLQQYSSIIHEGLSLEAFCMRNKMDLLKIRHIIVWGSICNSLHVWCLWCILMTYISAGRCFLIWAFHISIIMKSNIFTFVPETLYSKMILCSVAYMDSSQHHRYGMLGMPHGYDPWRPASHVLSKPNTRGIPISIKLISSILLSGEWWEWNVVNQI